MPDENTMQQRLRAIAAADNARMKAELDSAAVRHTAERLDRLAETNRRKAEIETGRYRMDSGR